MERKPIYCPNLVEILTQLQAEYPWLDTGQPNRDIIFAWGQDHGFETMDYGLVRAAVHNLGQSALETRKPVAVAPQPPPPPAPVQPRFDWHQFIASGKQLPLTAPDGSRCPPEVLERCTLKQVKDYVKAEDMEKKPWLTGHADQGLIAPRR
jgi:hypothetical protein